MGDLNPKPASRYASAQTAKSKKLKRESGAEKQSINSPQTHTHTRASSLTLRLTQYEQG